MALEYKDEYFLSSRELPNYEQVLGEKANKILEDLGYKHVHVGTDGKIYALSNGNCMINGYKIYVRKIPKL